MLYIYKIDNKYVISVNKPQRGTPHDKVETMREAQSIRQKRSNKQKQMRKENI